MSACNYTTIINDTDCIGDSRITLNNNFTNLDANLCNIISACNIQFPKIWNEINYALTSYALTSKGLAKAWVMFEGDGAVGWQNIVNGGLSQYNVASVYKDAIGVYTINFTTPMSDAYYLVVGNGIQNHPINGNVTVSEFWLNDTAPQAKTPTYLQICTLDTDVGNQGYTDCKRVNVVIYGN